MKPQINRSFSTFQDSGDPETDEEYWFNLAYHNHKGFSWSDLLKKRMVIILGEAGVGKSFEFEHKAEILTSENQFAFFLALNMLDTKEGFEHALIEQNDQYERWLKSNDHGYFFLDSLDDARLLKNPAALENALITVRQKVKSHLKRLSFFVSSRLTDWCIPAIRDVVHKHLLTPLIDAEVADIHINETNTDVKLEKPVDSPTVIDLEVFKLDPLAIEDAKKLADTFGAKPVDAFWKQVEEGGYEFLATRPLDLQWMAIRWKHTQTLGSYIELLEGAVTERLTEKNPNYVTAGAVLSRQQLREGAEKLAAACVFSGRAYVQVSDGESTPGSVVPADALPHWEPLEQFRLLNAAVFDETTFGRVKFHHRSVREYLAACWVEKQIADGLPVARALSLFIGSPYGKPVLLNTRRSVLCWLTALNAKVRQSVIKEFPEMLMFEGDPECWSTEDVTEAFEGYLQKLESGYRPDWRNDTSEIKRVARKLVPQVLAENLKLYLKKSNVVNRLLSLVKHGKVSLCADNIFSICRDNSAPERDRRNALIALAVVGTTDQKKAIADDLLSGRLLTEEFIAAALEVVGVENLSVVQLATVFSDARVDDGLGYGPLEWALQRDLLRNLGFDATLRLLSSLLTVLPTHDIAEITRRKKEDDPQKSWILRILPDVLLHALQLMNDTSETDVFTILTEASLLIEKLRHTTYVNDEDYRKLREEIEKRERYRQHLALCIALSKDIPDGLSSFTFLPGLIYFSTPDLDWLIQEAMREDLAPEKRHVWYEVVRDIAFYNLRGKQLQKIITTLTQGVDASFRNSDIQERLKGRLEGVRIKTRWKQKVRTEKKKKHRQMEAKKVELLKKLERIRSGEFDDILCLVRHSARHEVSKLTKVDINPITRDFGIEIGDAFSKGLARVWRQIDIPNPADYLDNRLPWAGLIGLASINRAFASGLQIADLNSDDVARAVQLCVWEHGQCEPWFAQLIETYPDKVAAALMPWLEFEIGIADEGSINHTVDLVLGGSLTLKKIFLERAQVLVQEGKVLRERLQLKLFREITGSGLASKEYIQALAMSRLLTSAKANPPKFASDWFVYWSASDFPAAWTWFETNAKALAAEPAQQAAILMEALGDLSWEKSLSGTVGETKALLALFRFLNASASDLEHIFSIRNVRDRIPGILASLRGKSAQESLQMLAAEHAGTSMSDWLLNLADEHASAAAECGAEILPAQLAAFGEVYTRDPRTEGELFQQVMARLEEIRENLEGGPFSDRVLFAPQMQEKHLQIWLAARLDDTPRRRFIPRFAVSREPQVDDDKRTDIEVSCAAGKACIEIKPLYKGCGYSANSLTGTLRDQLLGQYLKGRNSKHGVLVLFQLDSKKWQIPNGTRRGSFEDLVSYLRMQADRIKKQNRKVERLDVFGINCVCGS